MSVACGWRRSISTFCRSHSEESNRGNAVTEEDSWPSQIMSELMRIGVDLGSLPEMSFELDEPGLLERLQSLPVGATWRDVIPHLPAHWDMDDPTTWTIPYLPLGPADYQVLPTGPAILLEWPRTTDPTVLNALVEDAVKASWPIYAGWWMNSDALHMPTSHAYVVLTRDASEEQVHGFLQWLHTRADVQVSAVPRTGAERWQTVRT